MNKEYVLTTTKAEQVSQYDFETFAYTLKVLPTTTIAEIETWYRTIHSHGFSDFKITELQQLKK